MSGDTLVAGIGDEVITTFLLASFVCILLLFMFRKELNFHYSQLTTQIHRYFYGGEVETGEGAVVADAAMPDPSARHFQTATCPICLNEHTNPVETNCGHMFCGLCIRTYYEHGDLVANGMCCPLCRQWVSMFFICFNETELPNDNDNIQARSDRSRIVSMIRIYNERHSGNPRPLMSYLSDWPTLMRHLWNEFFTVGGLVYMFRIRIVMCFMAGLVYLFSPLDIVPEAVFGVLGLLDDLFVLFLLAVYVSIIYRRVVVARNFAN